MTVDHHCHLSADIDDRRTDALAAKINSLGLADGFFNLMTTYYNDLAMVDRLLGQLDSPTVRPYFGVHPWYSHLYTFLEGEDIKRRHYDAVLSPGPSEELFERLPEPINIERCIEHMEGLMSKYGDFGIGEIGLDKSVRVPLGGYYGSKSSSGLSPSKISMEHQKRVLTRFLDLAHQKKATVSVHCVQAHGSLYEILRKYTELDVILHSYSGSVDHAKMIVSFYKKQKARVRFSFSNWINGAKSEALGSIVGLLERDQVLTETDLAIDGVLVEKESEYFGQLEGIRVMLEGMETREKREI